MLKLLTAVEIYRKFVWYRGLACREEKGKISERKIWVIASKVFRTRSRTLLARNDPSTRSCRRSVVDDNGNPIFRNNICLEDQRLTSCDANVCVYMRVCTSVCSIPIVTSFTLFFNPFFDQMLESEDEDSIYEQE